MAVAARTYLDVCSHRGEWLTIRLLRWAIHPRCARCWRFTLSCREHWFCDLCENCREYYQRSLHDVESGNPPPEPLWW